MRRSAWALAVVITGALLAGYSLRPLHAGVGPSMAANLDWQSPLALVGWSAAVVAAGGVLGTWRRSRTDSDAQVIADAALRESQRQFQQLAESIEHVFWIHQIDPPRVVYVNEEFERVWGLPRESLDDDPFVWTDAIHRDDRASVEALIEDCVAGKRESFDTEFRIECEARGERWIIAEGKVLRDETGKPYRISGIAKDVTDARRNERQLRESEKRLELALWGTGLGLWDWDVRTGDVYYNIHWAHILGYHEDEIQPNIQAMMALIHPDDLAGMISALQSHLDGDAPFFESQHRMLARDGRWKWVLNRAKVVDRDATGGSQRMIGTVKDIDQEKWNEQRALGLGRVLDESLNEVYIFSTDTLRFVEVNRGARENLGYDLSELSKLTPTDICPDFRQVSCREVLKPLLSGEKAQLHFTSNHRRKDGTVYPVEVYLQSGVFEGRAVVVSMVLDITQRLAVEKRLRDSEEQFRLAFESLAAGMALAAIDGRFTRVNPALCEMLGYTTEEMCTLTVGAITHPNDQAAIFEWMRQLGDDAAGSFTGEMRYQRKDGHQVWGLASVSLARSASHQPTHFVMQIKDITVRKRAERALRRREREQQAFRKRLTALIEVTNQLSDVESVDEFFRRAVELGRSRLKFDRLSIWMFSANGKELTGTYGTDEKGRIRDERGCRFDATNATVRLARHQPYCIETDVPLFDDRVREVGTGQNVQCRLSDGDRTIGYISYDNLLKRQPIHEKDAELLAIYASSLSHLLSRKRVEETLRQREHHHRQVADARKHLLAEVNHRVRNNLAQLEALAKLPANRQSVEEFAATLRCRIDAMARTHGLVAGSGWQDVDLPDLVRAVAGSVKTLAVGEARLTVEGPPVLLTPHQALALAMTLQELFANSVKHGAYTKAGGRVNLTWTVENLDTRARVCLRWVESGGPSIVTPPTPAAGTLLMEGCIGHDLGGRCHWRYPPTGADHVIEFPLVPPPMPDQSDQSDQSGQHETPHVSA